MTSPSPIVEYWGCDLETSGLDPATAVPIQIGLYKATSQVGFSTFVGGWDWREHEWSADSYNVHGIKQRGLKSAPDATFAQKLAVGHIGRHSDVASRHRIAVGWNVAGFDMWFIDRHLPELRSQLSYRTVDLNAVCFALSDALHVSSKAMKRSAKTYAEQRLEEQGFRPQWHSALYDARAATLSYEYLVNMRGSGEVVRGELRAEADSTEDEEVGCACGSDSVIVDGVPRCTQALADSSNECI